MRNLLEEAIILAYDTGNQKYILLKDNTWSITLPYLAHCIQTVGVLIQHGEDREEVLAAAILHDYLEDTNNDHSYLQHELSDYDSSARVADLVYLVTNELGRNRAEIVKKTYKKIATDRDAICIKLADRISNLSCGIINGKLLDRYVKEDKLFQELFKPRGHSIEDVKHHKLWDTYNRVICLAKEIK
jgi:guanosine-3',5'-bis(diphosphate) 3'-pyrophosphohydrolase